MALNREIARSIKSYRGTAAHQVPWYQQPLHHKRTGLQNWYFENIYPTWFRYWKGPFQKFYYDRCISQMRYYGDVLDDHYFHRSHMIERAHELLPYDLQVGRFRRCYRACELSMKKQGLPTEYQNYDPMVPYLAPYFEEAKFMLQEEQELLDYHPFDRRLYTGSVSGFGETLPNSTLTTYM